MSSKGNGAMLASNIPIFNGDLYEYWAIQMRTLFLSKGLWEIVQNGVPTLATTSETGPTAEELKTAAENRRKDARALVYIQQGVTSTIFPRIMAATSSQEAWETLQVEYKGSPQVISIKLQTAWKVFDTLLMKENEKVQDFIARATQSINQIRMLGDTIEDKRVVPKLLRSLTPQFNHIVAAIEESKDLNIQSIPELLGSLQAHEDRLNHQPPSMEQALHLNSLPIRNNTQKQKFGKTDHMVNKKLLFTNNRGRGSGRNSPQERSTYNKKGNFCCSLCNRTNHEAHDCFYKCKRCKKPTHMDKDCWFKDKMISKNIEEEKKEAMFYLNDKKNYLNTTWYIDSGCSSHMTGNKNLFVYIDESFTADVVLGDGNVQKIQGIGTIKVKTVWNQTRYIYDVSYVPTLTANLLSVGQLLHKGYEVHFTSDSCTIINKSGETEIIAKMTSNRIFSLNLYPDNEVVLTSTAQIQQQTKLWHQRLGHLNGQDMKKLSTQHMVEGLPPITTDNTVCEKCAEGKNHRLPSPKTSYRRSLMPLDLIHSDLWGPSTTPSLSGKIYFLLFVDDCSRFMWIYFLKHKSDSFETFQIFKALVEKQFERSIKILRTDRGGEFISNEFTSYCSKEGIRRELTASRSPQQNGVVERRNRTIIEMARTMLLSKSMPKEFWAEAAHTAVYILNRSPTKALIKQTPYEGIYKRKPKVTHFKIFGCIAYVLIQKEDRGKLDKKSERCIFIGYSNESKAFRLYQTVQQKLIISRDVLFDEDRSWDWGGGSEMGQDSQSWSYSRARDTFQINETQANESQMVEPQTPTISNTENTQLNDASPASSSSTYYPDSSSPPRRMRTLEEIYKQGEVVLNISTPSNFEEAYSSPAWKQAMDEEIKMVVKNNTWVLVTKPPQADIIGLKWIFKLKEKEDGSVLKYKARIVAKGYSQVLGIDYNETFAPVVRMETVRTLIAYAAQYNFPIYQLDVNQHS
ncbi:hypothetical protein KSP39_PZI020061 [Platanthera zijinensis]|uniref:Integrase catalytic domain-containing protein n=1 Tax=Platanthera zijinensis TaxID=2320716 RepID=A0AAP0B116_9ASPA